MQTLQFRKQEKMNQQFDHLTKTMKYILNLLNRQIEMEAKEKQTQLTLLHKKCKMLQGKYEKLQVILQEKVEILDLRLTRLEPNTNKGTTDPFVGINYTKNAKWQGALVQAQQDKRKVATLEKNNSGVGASKIGYTNVFLGFMYCKYILSLGVFWKLLRRYKQKQIINRKYRRRKEQIVTGNVGAMKQLKR